MKAEVPLNVPSNGDNKRESRQEDFDLHYDKINEMYYGGDKFVEESFYSNRTESVTSKDVQGTSAELILRELFVPVKEDSAVCIQNPKIIQILVSQRL